LRVGCDGSGPAATYVEGVAVPDESDDDLGPWLRPGDYQRGLCAWAAWITGDVETRDAQTFLAMEAGRFDQFCMVLDALLPDEDEDPVISAMLRDEREVLRMVAEFASQELELQALEEKQEIAERREELRRRVFGS
jgi:hypothetical protein